MKLFIEFIKFIKQLPDSHRRLGQMEGYTFELCRVPQKFKSFIFKSNLNIVPRKCQFPQARDMANQMGSDSTRIGPVRKL